MELWKPRTGVTALSDPYDPAPILVGVDPDSFMADIGCVHRAVGLWEGTGSVTPATPAEIAARQVEAADVLILPASAADGGGAAPGPTALIAHLNAQVRFLTATDCADAVHLLPPSLMRPAPAGAAEAWRESLDPVSVSCPGEGAGTGRIGALRARRPLHPERLADALGAVMAGVARSRGHLRLSSRPDAVTALVRSHPSANGAVTEVRITHTCAGMRMKHTH
ncbi:GTP-binding protein [Streptomyces sp. NPDC054797]